ncbi:MAG: GDP-mannose 4,6-dehydratase [Candidatus Aenigmatarchaeota archaeon]
MYAIQRDIDEIKTSLKPFWKNIEGQRFLITGGAGFLGSWMCDALLSMGGHVTCVDNMASGFPKNIEHLKDNKNFRLLRADITTFETNEKFDYVIHMASVASPPLYQKIPIETLDAGVIGTKRMLELAVSSKGFLFTSTSEVYGNPPDNMVPTPETYYGYVNSYGPRSMYDESKRCAEAYCYSYWKQKNVPVRIARIFNTYGPRLDAKSPGGYGRALVKFVYQALRNEPISMYGDGSQTRSFCYVTDQIAGLVKLLLTPDIDGDVVNIGNESEITIAELIGKVLKTTNSSSKIVHSEPAYDLKDDPRRRRPDTKKAKKLLGWTPTISLDEGLKRTAEWMREVI